MTSAKRRLSAALIALTLCLARPAAAADQWIEMKSAHFTIVSNAGKGLTSKLAWQLEQMRSVVTVIWPWAKVDLNTPLLVFALKDEQSLKTLAPEYWERKGGAGAATVWISGYGRTFLALRTDVEQDAKRHVNPYASSYFAYFSLVLQQSVPRRLPPWLARGMAALLSNTIVEEDSVLIGPPIPWYIERVREGRHVPLAELTAARADSPLLKTERNLFDAQAWALVHYLMFADKGARSKDFQRFSSLVLGGADPDAAFREAIGQAADLENPVRAYVDRSLFAYSALKADAEVKREAFGVTSASAADAAAKRALFHATMRRPVEARAAIEEARKAGGAPDAEVAEAVLLDAEDKRDAARAAYARAVDAGTTDAFAHYRLAFLLWRRDADRDTLTKIAALLLKASGFNPRYAAAYDFLAQINSELGEGEPSGLALRAVSLEPDSARFRLTAARLLANEKRFDDALKQVTAAAELADSDDLAREAAQLRTWIERRKSG